MSGISDDLRSFWVACIGGKLDPSLLKALKTSLAVKDKWGRSAASRAVVWGRLEVLGQLVSSGVKLADDIDLEGNTLLHRAASYAQADTCAYLLKQGVKADKLNSAGETALAIATRLADTRYLKTQTIAVLTSPVSPRK